MKIRTVDELLDRIGNERVWRIREIAALRSQCFSTLVPDDARRVLRRSFLPIAYAHWEGFVKKSSHYYLEFVAMQRLRLSELNWQFVSMFLVQEYKRDLTSMGSNSLSKICKYIDRRADDPVRLHYEGVISTKSNLNSSKFKEICISIGIEYIEFQSKEIFIDNNLLGKRNRIAHGEEQYVDKEDIDHIKLEVVWLIDSFRNKIENAAVNRGFMRS